MCPRDFRSSTAMQVMKPLSKPHGKVNLRTAGLFQTRKPLRYCLLCSARECSLLNIQTRRSGQKYMLDMHWTPPLTISSQPGCFYEGLSSPTARSCTSKHPNLRSFFLLKSRSTIGLLLGSCATFFTAQSGKHSYRTNTTHAILGKELTRRNDVSVSMLLYIWGSSLCAHTIDLPPHHPS